MDRRAFLTRAAALSVALGAPLPVVTRATTGSNSSPGSAGDGRRTTRPGASTAGSEPDPPESTSDVQVPSPSRQAAPVTLFLAGDVMTGRGIDQVLPNSVDPRLFEPYVRDAREYVELAEEENGPIPEPVDFAYIWGDGLDELERVAPDARIINLETAVTRHDEPWRGKQVHYRMHPANLPCLAAAGVDCCVLANNHVLDWGVDGLLETLRTLADAGIDTAGAGRDAAAATAPTAREYGDGRRILVFGLGHVSSGIPPDWAAEDGRPGVNLLKDLSARTASRVAEAVGGVRRDGDVVVASIHWGSNWGYQVPRAQREFAHRLIDAGAADVVHGHSSHHPRPIEVYRGRPILYGCGDLINDYEGIAGRERFRGELALMYFPTLDAGGGLVRLRMSPMRIRRFRLERASQDEVEWLRYTLNRESEAFGTRAEPGPDGVLELRWDQ